MRNAPNAPVVPRLLYADATPEALAHGLASQWPSGILLSAEAGAVFGAHAMGIESVVRNLALLNVLWDGGEIAIDRRSKPSFLLRDRRLSLGLMVQPQTLRAFIAKAGALPRGSGFLARPLIAWPGNKQGQRAYRAAPASMDHVARFEARIRALLDHPLPTDAHVGLDPAVLDLSDEARAEWVRFHDATEAAMGPDGCWREIRATWQRRPPRTRRDSPRSFTCSSTARAAASAIVTSRPRCASFSGTCRRRRACCPTSAPPAR